MPSGKRQINIMATAQKSSQDNFVAYIAAAVVVCLAGIVMFTWNQVRIAHDATRPHVAFTKFGPYQIETQTYALRASLTVQTSLDDANWAENNRKSLDVVFKKVLADADAQTMRMPNTLLDLQQALTNGCEATFHTKTVQAVLLTDFTFQTRDAQG